MFHYLLQSQRAGYCRLLMTLLCLLVILPPAVAQSGARSIKQKRQPSSDISPIAVAKQAAESLDETARAMTAACRERELDPQGSVPIDVLQARPSLPLAHGAVVAGVERAERLLPVAKLLAAESLTELARETGVNRVALREGLRRVRRVTMITPDMELRDNASVLFAEPRAIRFGTLFLAGLNSDESMISVLAHELTHVTDGPRSSLSPLFRAVARRASRAARLRLSAQRGEELACDLVGVMATRRFITQTPTLEPRARRAARAVAHNCVVQDATDASHLSPRTTMRALLALEPAFAREITGEAEAFAPPAAPPRSRRRKATTHHVPR